jgi:heat shock protein 5
VREHTHKKKKKKKKQTRQSIDGPVVGIDLGTTFSVVGIFKDGRVEIIANDQGNRITPSGSAFTPDGERLIGEAAKNQGTLNPENTVFDVKRLIGRKYDARRCSATRSCCRTTLSRRTASR